MGILDIEMLTFATKYGGNVYSQNGEDMILEEVIRRMPLLQPHAVEFGAPSWEYCSNTAYLANKGWSVRMYDIEPNDPKVTKAEITTDNVNEIVGNPSLLSIDVDNDDYFIWAAYKGTPVIVIIEINSGIHPALNMIPGSQGTSYKSMVELGISKGYFLLCHTGNLIFVRNDFKALFPEIHSDPIKDYPLYFNTSHLC